jgi:hypothetical protein
MSLLSRLQETITKCKMGYDPKLNWVSKCFRIMRKCGIHRPVLIRRKMEDRYFAK